MRKQWQKKKWREVCAAMSVEEECDHTIDAMVAVASVRKLIDELIGNRGTRAAEIAPFLKERLENQIFRLNYVDVPYFLKEEK